MRLAEVAELRARMALACRNCDGVTGAHCIHELWMRGELAANIEQALERLWQGAAETIPDWLPPRTPSVTVIVCVPTVGKVAVKVCVPISAPTKV